MNYDVIVVGAGPAGLACAIHLKQLAVKNNREISIAVIDKGSSVGSHIISGCVLNPESLSQLIPDWKELDFPIHTQVKHEELRFLTKAKSFKLPHLPRWGNSGNYIISLSQLCVKLATYAEELGVEIYPSIAIKAPIIQANRVVGVVTNDTGVLKDGTHGRDYQPGFEMYAKQVVLAEGARGSVTKQVVSKFGLDQNAAAETYGLGIKEVWQIEAKNSIPGNILHYVGYPLNNNAYGGGFLYHLQENIIAIGLVTALDYTNPYLNPYQEFQKFKSHHEIQAVLANGKRLEYGARVIVEGGVQSLVKPTFPGGLLVGDSLGLVNVPKIKGVDNAISSAMIAAAALLDNIENTPGEIYVYAKMLYESKVYKDLYQVRNFRPAFKFGLIFGLIHGGFDYLTRGLLPYTLKHAKPDNLATKLARGIPEIYYPLPDNKISFDRLSSIYLANINYQDGQLVHLQLKDKNIPLTVNLTDFAALETRYCPAQVYEIIDGANENKVLQINAGNCIHCKACDIKDPSGNINWTTPDGASGPQYSLM